MDKVVSLIVPTEEQQKEDPLQSLVDQLIDTAREIVYQQHGDVIHDKAQAEIEAEIYFEALRVMQDNEEIIRSIQAHVVAEMGRTSAWVFHPNGYDEGERGLRQFLKDVGLGKNQVSRLTFIGAQLTPYCDAHDIEIDHLLSKEHRGKTKAAIPKLRQAIDHDDPEKVQDILDTVERAKNRAAIRNKYTDRREKFGRGTTCRLPGGRVVLVAVLDDDEAAKSIVQRLGGGIKWELVATAHQLKNSVRLALDESPNGGPQRTDQHHHRDDTD